MAMTTIRLYGKLGATFGRVHRLDVESPSEAIRALSVLHSGFQRFFMTARQRGMTFAVFKGKRNIDRDELMAGHGDLEIRIAPIMMASKKAGLFQTILGAVMIVVGVALAIFTGGTLATFGASLAWAGGSMMAGGVVQMLSPQPQGLKMGEDADNKPNYAFGGPVNSTAVGNIVSVLYGEREIGGAVISGGILAEQN